ncbi:MAG: DUF1501 domain-containing protein [Acidobacteria bacterium]|nr:MAG: DUF1501 domain-containing protein [Acidobacteriota bacterium]
MFHDWKKSWAPPSRRQFLACLGEGFGTLVLSHLLLQDELRAQGPSDGGRPDLNGGLHHRARAKRVIQLFMNGGVSQSDTFDYKPQLIRYSGQKFDPGPGLKVESVTGSPGFIVMKSPFTWKQHGQCGRWVSEVLPQIATCVDDLAFLMAMTTKTNVHGPAVYQQNSGFTLPGFPCLGAWLSYGLGRLNENMPAFVVLPDSRGLPYNGQGSFSSGFLPAAHQGTLVRATAPVPINDLFAPRSAAYITEASEEEGLALLGDLNREHLAHWQGDSRLEARITAYELAARMQLSIPGVFDISKESEATRKLYGLDEKDTEDFGRSCLIARRLLEQGVRFVQVWSGTNWDNHSNITNELGFIAKRTDMGVAGLFKDLKARGLLEDTLVIWTTEFGRMPFSQGSSGRDHNGGTFVTWLGGAGIKGGVAHGQSDEWAWKAVENSTASYDLHATILHLLGIDHKKLTYRHNGIDRRLTDVHGHVIREILA